MTARIALALGLFCSAASFMTKAHAYRNPERFAGPAEEGGGGGRFFTLSRAEGYGCAACHTQGEAVPVDVLRLPLGFTPGETFRITIDWPDDKLSVALNVEMTTPEGVAFGQLLVPDPLTLSAADMCRASDDPSAGQTLSLDPNGRRVLLVAECGQAQTTFDWVAPAEFEQGYLSASITFSNRDGKLSGDQVIDVSEPFSALPGTEATTNVYQNSCTTIATSHPSPMLPRVFACCLFVLFVSRCFERSCTRTRTRRRKLNYVKR